MLHSKLAKEFRLINHFFNNKKEESLIIWRGILTPDDPVLRLDPKGWQRLVKVALLRTVEDSAPVCWRCERVHSFWACPGTRLRTSVSRHPNHSNKCDPQLEQWSFTLRSADLSRSSLTVNSKFNSKRFADSVEVPLSAEGSSGSVMFINQQSHFTQQTVSRLINLVESPAKLHKRLPKTV